MRAGVCGHLGASGIGGNFDIEERRRFAPPDFRHAGYGRERRVAGRIEIRLQQAARLQSSDRTERGRDEYAR